MSGRKIIDCSYSKFAYTPSEGVGIGGSFNITATALFERGKLKVWALGQTPASSSGTVYWSGRVTFRNRGSVVGTKTLADPGGAHLLPPNKTYIGEVIWDIPGTRSNMQLEFDITYALSTPAGMAVPISIGTVTKNIDY